MPMIIKNNVRYCSTGGDAENIVYDNAESGMEATNMQDAIDELNSNLSAGELQFKFATDGEGNYGYLGADDSFIPFKQVIDEIFPPAFSIYGCVPFYKSTAKSFTISGSGCHFFITRNNGYTKVTTGWSNFYISTMKDGVISSYVSGTGTFDKDVDFIFGLRKSDSSSSSTITFS